jgi:outer membrane immunogenic protein
MINRIGLWAAGAALTALAVTWSHAASAQDAARLSALQSENEALRKEIAALRARARLGSKNAAPRERGVRPEGSGQSVPAPLPPTAALAADMPAAPSFVRAATQAPWAGVYIGGFAGSHWSTDRYVSDEGNPSENYGPFDLALNGFAAGGLISGVNIQHGNFVWGLETDIGLLYGKNVFNPPGGIDSITTDFRYNAHARLRFGWSMGPWLPFVAAGVAYANTRTTMFRATNNPPLPDTQSLTQHRIGYTIGGGVDWMLSSHWMARVEYLHDRYLTTPFALPVAVGDAHYFELNSNTVRGALLYRFDSRTPHAALGGTFKSPIAAPAATWAGLYIGGFAGGHRSTDNWASDEAEPAERFGPFNLGVDGFTAGGLIGANVQYGNYVWGVEADVGLLTGSRTFGSLEALFGFAEIDSIKTEMRWNAHARIRSGYSFGAWMPFVATGLAYANTRVTLVDSGTGRTANISLDRIGLSAGVGVDWMFNPNWLARAEYIYDRYATANFAVAIDQADSHYMALHSHIVRGALMYRFGDGSALLPADGDIKTPAPAVAAWTGGYIGAFAGGHRSRERWTSDETAPPSRVGPLNYDIDGFTGGGLVGANLQHGNYVWGIEADVGALTGSRNFGPLAALFPVATIDSIETRMRWNAHGRLRFGYAAGHWLPFVAGGVAYASTRVRVVNEIGQDPPSSVITLNRIGVTFGGGVDWRFASNWIGRVEYLHDRYGTASFATVTRRDSEHMELQSNIVRGALIYQFDAGPVVARY